MKYLKISMIPIIVIILNYEDGFFKTNFFFNKRVNFLSRISQTEGTLLIFGQIEGPVADKKVYVYEKLKALNDCSA